MGVIFLSSGLYSLSNAIGVLRTNQGTTGTVISRQTKTDPKSGNALYFPVVTFFEEKTGKTITIRSSVGTSTRPWRTGDKVSVLYNPDRPEDATINSFRDLWLFPVFSCGFGALGIAMGFSHIVSGTRKRRRVASLLKAGYSIKAQIIFVEQDRPIRYFPPRYLTFRSPYIIGCQWTDPLDPEEIYVFRSDNIWFDPTPYLDKDYMQVFIDSRNRDNYYVDTRFLPKSQ